MTPTEQTYLLVQSYPYKRVYSWLKRGGRYYEATGVLKGLGTLRLGLAI